MRFVTCIILIFLNAGYVLAQTNYRLEYNPEFGRLSLYVPAKQPEVYSLLIRSQSGIFTGRPRFSTKFLANTNMFAVSPAFGSITGILGPIAERGHSEEFLLDDLCVTWKNKAGLTPDLFLGNSPLKQCLPKGPDEPGEVFLDYDDRSGQLQVKLRDDLQLTSFLIDSRHSSFVGHHPSALDGSFDIFRDDRVFKFDAQGFGAFDLGRILLPRLSTSALLTQYCASGSFANSGEIKSVRINGYEMGMCNEPSFDRAAPPWPHNGIPSSTLTYSPVSGDVRLEFATGVTTYEINSVEGFFRGERPAELSGLFDVFTQYKLFKIDPGGMGSLSLPGSLQTGLTFDDLYNDLSFEGISGGGGGPIGDPQIIVVPELTSSRLLIVCLLFCYLRNRDIWG